MNADNHEAGFIKGLELSEIFYREAVKPILESRFPDLLYSAGRLGSGSDVLGFDTEQSMDHGWGPKLTLFLTESDHEALNEEIDQCLRQELPLEIRGFSTNLGLHEDGTDVMIPIEEGPVNHRVDITTADAFFKDYLGFNPVGELRPIDWLILPEQRLRSIASGRVFYDGLNELEAVLTKLEYYPNDVWLYLLANQWRRISQEEAFMGRCGQVGDELGSRLIAGRLILDLMKLCFLMERQYAPYIKWFGTAFSCLVCASKLTPIFAQTLDAQLWTERQKHLTSAYEIVAQMHNDLGITKPLNTKVSQFHGRPFLIIQANDFADAILASIDDDGVKALPKYLGGIDQFVDSTDVLAYPARYRLLTAIYE